MGFVLFIPSKNIIYCSICFHFVEGLINQWKVFDGTAFFRQGKIEHRDVNGILGCFDFPTKPGILRHEKIGIAFVKYNEVYPAADKLPEVLKIGFYRVSLDLVFNFGGVKFAIIKPHDDPDGVARQSFP